MKFSFPTISRRDQSVDSGGTRPPDALLQPKLKSTRPEAGLHRLVRLAFLLALSSPLVAPRSASGAELATLDANLSYLRIHSLADAAPALSAALAADHAFVLDLRYTTASDESASVLCTALNGHPGQTPLLVLISPATPPAVLEALNRAQGSYITLGVSGSRSASHIAVKTDAETDRRAYDAFESGTPVGVLISGKIEKERFDEAVLVQEFKNGNPDAEPPTPPDPTAAKLAPIAEKAPLLIDRVLQRAVQLHQALVALRR